MPVPIIDLFAGPGGLGEGFSSLLDKRGERSFKIKLSIEKDEHAHSTLELRAFFREFAPAKVPEDYYSYLRGEISRSDLYARHPQAAAEAKKEAWEAELGHEATPDSMVDERIHKALAGHSKWLLIGGPPCQAYSLVGRSRVIGGEGLTKYENDPKHGLYRHYLRILAVHQPPVFVMENVKGLLSAKIGKDSTFDKILADLRNPSASVTLDHTNAPKKNVGYKLCSLVVSNGDMLGDLKPKDFVVCTENYGVPQARHRIIIIGIRSDWAWTPDLLSPEASPSVEEVIGDLPRLRSGLSKELDSSEAWREAILSLGDAAWLGKESFKEELREAFFKTIGRVGAKLDRGGAFVPAISSPKRLAEWFHDPKLKGVCNHQTRGHIRADLHRYFFASVFSRKNGRSPLLEDFPKALLPKHENVTDALKETKFNDRFRVQIAGRPSTTVVSHIAKDGHYFIHYDPTQCRSLTVREAARLQTFPDNYLFEGPRTEQYQQVGNAVPPLLAYKIAKSVAKLFN